MSTDKKVEQRFMLTSTLTGSPLNIFLIGAGGNGARVAPPLHQMLRRGDSVSIIDHDIVEDRNLARQHFHTGDIGRPKAVVLAERYRRAGITTTPYATRLQTGSAGAGLRQELVARTCDQRTGHYQPIVWIGCVDNPEARAAIKYEMEHSFTSHYQAWIDVGNETRGGQVILSLRAWPLRVVDLKGEIRIDPLTNDLWHMDGMAAMPQLLRPAPWPCGVCAKVNEPSAVTCAGCQGARQTCGERVDLQTVMVNHLAAATVINVLSWLMMGLPFSGPGSFFSTLNSMQPIFAEGVDLNRRAITPEKTYVL